MDHQQAERGSFSGILRAASGPERSELIALPESRHEVESIAADCPLCGARRRYLPAEIFQG
jgi:hypothetical protein